MNNLEVIGNPEIEQAARLDTMIRFGQLAVYQRPDYQVFTDIEGAFCLDVRDDLREFDEQRLQDGETHIRELHAKVLSLTGISADQTYYDATAVSRFYYDDSILNSTFLLHMVDIDIGGHKRAQARQFIFQTNDYYTLEETRLFQYGQTILADSNIHPRQDDLSRSVEDYFASKVGSNTWPLQALVHAALVGSQNAAQHLKGVTEETATEPELRQLLTRVVERSRIVTPRKDSEISPGPPTEDKLDMITRVLFRATNLG